MDNVKWVEARAGFSLDAVFRELLAGARTDVEAWKAQRRSSDDIR